MLLDKSSLQCLVADRLVQMGSEEVAHREVAVLVLASGLADVQVVGARALRGQREEVEVRECRVGHEQIAQPLERLAVRLERIDRRHGQLQVDDWLRRQTRHGGRAHVVHPHRDLAERTGDAAHLGMGQRGPLRIVVHDPDRRVESVVE